MGLDEGPNASVGDPVPHLDAAVHGSAAELLSIIGPPEQGGIFCRINVEER